MNLPPEAQKRIREEEEYRAKIRKELGLTTQTTKRCSFCKEPKSGGFFDSCPHCGKTPSNQLALSCLGLFAIMVIFIVMGYILFRVYLDLNY